MDVRGAGVGGDGHKEGDFGKRKVYGGYLTDVLSFMNETSSSTCMHSSLWDCSLRNDFVVEDVFVKF